MLHDISFKMYRIQVTVTLDVSISSEIRSLTSMDQISADSECRILGFFNVWWNPDQIPERITQTFLFPYASKGEGIPKCPDVPFHSRRKDNQTNCVCSLNKNLPTYWVACFKYLLKRLNVPWLQLMADFSVRWCSWMHYTLFPSEQSHFYIAAGLHISNGN